jgi:hypothetical protein
MIVVLGAATPALVFYAFVTASYLSDPTDRGNEFAFFAGWMMTFVPYIAALIAGFLLSLVPKPTQLGARYALGLVLPALAWILIFR